MNKLGLVKSCYIILSLAVDEPWYMRDVRTDFYRPRNNTSLSLPPTARNTERVAIRTECGLNHADFNGCLGDFYILNIPIDQFDRKRTDHHSNCHCTRQSFVAREVKIKYSARKFPLPIYFPQSTLDQGTVARKRQRYQSLFDSWLYGTLKLSRPRAIGITPKWCINTLPATT